MKCFLSLRIVILFHILVSFCKNLLFLLSLVPTAAATNLSAVASSSTSLNITFLPPLGIDQNGPIQGYDVFYTGMFFFTSTLSQIILVTEIDPLPNVFYQTITLTGLDVYESFDLQIRAFNVEGTGPVSNVFNGMTAEDGKCVYMCIIWFSMQSCGLGKSETIYKHGNLFYNTEINACVKFINYVKFNDKNYFRGTYIYTYSQLHSFW